MRKAGKCIKKFTEHPKYLELIEKTVIESITSSFFSNSESQENHGKNSNLSGLVEVPVLDIILNKSLSIKHYL